MVQALTVFLLFLALPWRTQIVLLTLGLGLLALLIWS
jgi:hypothetical protein